LYYFLESIFGRNNCVMVPSIKALLVDFNSHLGSKLFIFIDDLDCATNKETGRLKGRITCEYCEYTEKNKTPIRLKCCEEYVATSNCKTPLYTNAEDRRQLFIPISGEMASKDNSESLKYFDELYAEFADLDVCKAWFTFFKDRDISKVSGHQSCDPKACVEIFHEQSSNCMRLPHKWLAEFFGIDEFIAKYKKFNETTWFSKQDMTKTRKGKAVLMLTDHAYTVYSRWVKNDCPRSKPGSKSDFLNALAEMKIKPSKTKFLGANRRNILRFMRKKIVDGMEDVYGHSQVAEWPDDKEWKFLSDNLTNMDSRMGERVRCMFNDASGDIHVAMEE
jgi:hypothetical protein